MAASSSSRSSHSAEPKLVPQGDYAGKPPLRLQKSVVVVGGAEHCHLHLISSSVSRHHALIIHDRDGVYIRDLGSRTKVVVNGQPQRETLLANEDEIHIGKFSFRFSFAGPLPDAAAANPPMKLTVTGRAEPLVTHCRTVLIGKGDGCDISLGEESVSHRHAIIFTVKGKRYLRDLDSRTGTFVDGEKIHQEEIKVGSQIRVGETIIMVAEIGQATATAEAPREEAAAVPPEAEHKPVAEAAAPADSKDAEPLLLEPEPEEAAAGVAEPAAIPFDLPEPLGFEPAAETKADAVEAAPAAHSVEPTKDSIPIETVAHADAAAEEPLAVPFDMPEPLKLEPESPINIDIPESAPAADIIDLAKDSIPIELDPAETPAASAEPPAIPLVSAEVAKPEPVSEAKADAFESALAADGIDFGKDSVPVEAEAAVMRSASTEPSPAADLDESIKIEPTAESSADAFESALAADGVDLHKDSIAVEPEPLHTPVVAERPFEVSAAQIPEPIKLEVEPETTTNGLEAALAEAEIELKKNSNPVEAAEEARSEEPSTASEEAWHPETELPHISIDLDLEPAAEPHAAADDESAKASAEIADLSAADLPSASTTENLPASEPAKETVESAPQLEQAIEEASGAPPLPVDLNLDLNADAAEKVDSAARPAIKPAETFESTIELTPMEIASDQPPVAPSEDVIQDSPADEGASAKPRKRPARGRKAAPKSVTKAPKSPRGKAKRVPPQAAEAAESSGSVLSAESVDRAEPVAPETAVSEPAAEMNVRPEPETPLNWPGEMDAAPAAAEEISDAFVPDEPSAIAPAISVQPQAPETPAAVEDISKDVWHEPEETSEEVVPAGPIGEEISTAPIPDEYSAEANLLSGEMEILETPPEVIEPSAGSEEPVFEGVEVAPDASEMSAGEMSSGELTPAGITSGEITPGEITSGEWKIPASANEEISPPIVSDDQTEEQPAVSIESEIPEAPLVEGVMTSGEWAIPPAAATEPAAPVVVDQAAPLVPPSPQVAPRVVRQPAPAQSQFLGSIGSLGGFSFIGGGEVNLDHSLGGMPILLPELPATPPGFGKIRIDLGGKLSQGESSPKSARAAITPPPAAPPAAPPPPPQAGAERVAAQAPSPFPLDVSKGLPFATGIEHPIGTEAPLPPAPAAKLPKPATAFDGLAMGANEEPDFFSDDSKEVAAKDGGDGASVKAAKRPETPLRPDTPEALIIPEDDLNELPEEEPGDVQSDAAMPPAPAAPPPAVKVEKRRRFRIPFFMPLILVGVGVAIAAIWKFIPVQSQISGTMTFVNFSYIPGTQDSIDFEAAQRRMLDDQTRTHASEILARDYPGIGQGFLQTPESFDKVAASISLASSSESVTPQTLLQLSYTGTDKDADRLRMLALLQALADRNGPRLDSNRQVREKLAQAQQRVDDAQRKLDGIKTQLADLAPIIDAAPAGVVLDELRRKESGLEKNSLDAEAAVSRDRADIARLASVTVASATTQPAADDPELKQMKQQLADLSAEMDSARSDQLAGAALARQKLQLASRQFDEQIAAANTLLGGGSQLRQFVDSAMESQTKARDLINMLIVDGEDLEQQLEDTRRDIDDLIQTQQDEKWALDPQLQSLRENLDSAQHRYNANAGQGVTDPRILDPLQKEIDDCTAQVKARQAQLGADPGELKVQESLNGIIDAMRKKLTREKHQTDQVLDPLQQQLASLNPVISALPAAQQDLALQLHERLDALNDARQKFAETFGDEQLAPSEKITELKNRIADLKADIVARQADLEHAAVVARDQQQKEDTATLQMRLQTDEQKFADASKALEAGMGAYNEVHSKQVAAEGAQQRKIGLLDDQTAAYSELEASRRDRDEKQSAADHAFDIKPVTAGDVIATAPPDPRMMYSLVAMGGGLLAVALAAIFSHAGRGRSGNKPVPEHGDADFDSLVIPMATDDDHPATA